MSKTVDVDLRIRAKNLAKTSLRQINDDIDKLADSQKKQATASGLAARSFRELATESNSLRSVLGELNRRGNVAKNFIEQQKLIKDTAADLERLTTEYRELAKGQQSQASLAGLRALAKQITDTNEELGKLVKNNAKVETAFNELGVDANKAGDYVAELQSVIAKTDAAYKGSTDALQRYTGAVRLSAEASQIAAQREADHAAQIERNRAVLRKFGVQREDRSDLTVLRADIEARSRQAKELEIQAEASRRLGAEQNQLEKSEREVTAATLASINAYVARKRRLEEAVKTFQGMAVAQEREAALNARLSASQDASNKRRARLIELLKTERGQRLLGIGGLNQEAAARERSEGALRRAGQSLGLFNDTGRKSLSVYQRLRGQVLGLTTAYIGLYQAFSVFQQSIEKTNQNQALNIGLARVNNGDARKAADDYEFLRKEADRLGLVFDDVAPKYVGMAIAGKAVGLSNRDIRGTFTDVATSVAASNLSIDDSEGVFRAIVQIMSKARVQAEELRGQLGDRLPGAVAEFAKQNEIALTDLDKHLKDGKGTVEQLIKFLHGYAESSATDIDQVTGRLQAYINRAKNAYNDFLRTLLSGGNDKKLAQAFQAMEQFFKSEQGARFAATLATGIAKLIDLFILLANNIDLVEKAIKAFLFLQLGKAFVDMAGSGAKLLTFIGQLTTGMVGLTSKTAAATLATNAFAGSTARLALAAGGIAAILAGIAAALYLQGKALDSATAKTDAYINSLSNLTHAQGVEGLTSAIDTGKKRIKEYSDQINKLNDLQGGLGSLNPLARFSAQNQAAPLLDDNERNQSGATKKINELLHRQRQEIEAVEAAEVRLGKAAGERAEEEAKAAREAAAAYKAPKEKAEKVKKETGPTVEDDIRKQAAAQRAIEREALALQDSILQKQMQNGEMNSAMLERNHELQLKRIEIEYQDQLEKNEALAAQAAKASQDAAARGRPVVDVSAQLTTLNALAERQQQVAKDKAAEDLAAGQILLKEKAINDLIDERNAKLQLINTQKELGTISELEAYRQANLAQDEYNANIRQLTTELITLLTSIDPNSDLYTRLGVPRLIAGLKQANAEAAKLTNVQKFFNKFGADLAGGVANSLVELGKGLAGFITGANSLGDAFKGAMDSFRTFAADFLQNISQMILQAILLQAIQNAINGTSGGYGQAISAVFGHTGGVVGSGSGRIGTNPTKKVSPALFAGAQRFHGGGVIPGLKKNEVPIIGKVGEEMLTEDDPRHVNNGGMGVSPVDLTMINTIDPGDVVRQGYAQSGNVIFNHIAANKNRYRRAMGLGTTN